MRFRVLLIIHYLIREILVEGVLDVHARGVKIKKKFIEKYLCWYAHREPYILHDTMVEKMVRSTSNSSNVHEVVDGNGNLYRNMVIDTMEIN